MLKVSRQKIYDSLVSAEKKYKSFKCIVVFSSYTKVEGRKLNFVREECSRRECWIKNIIELTQFLNKKKRFEIAKSVVQETEIWIGNNKFRIGYGGFILG